MDPLERDSIPSPCLQICSIGEGSFPWVNNGNKIKLCTGCLRDIDTITDWSSMGVVAKLNTYVEIFRREYFEKHGYAFKPQRIVSLVPSITQTVIDLGMENSLVGITGFCPKPPSPNTNLKIIGGTKNFKKNTISDLKPDLILANKEENPKPGILDLLSLCPIHVCDIKTVKDSGQYVKILASMLSANEGSASKLLEEIKKVTVNLLLSQDASTRRSVAYLIWKDPLMTVGADTYIHDVLSCLGYDNVFSDLKRYPEITLEAIKERNAEVVLLSDEPYPFNQIHKEEFSRKLPRTEIQLVSGKPFSWFGSGMLELNQLLNSTTHNNNR